MTSDPNGGPTPAPEPGAASTVPPVPLVVDVDGTLIASDFLHESLLGFVAAHPWRLPQLPLVLAQAGKAGLKQALAGEVPNLYSHIPLRRETEALIEAARAEGRPVFLASASDRRLVEGLAARIGGIAGVLATEGGQNLAGAAKAAALVARFGAKGFDYVGDAPVDIPVWEAARQVLLVSHSDRFERRVLDLFPDAIVVCRSRVALRDLVRSLRPHQWTKNLLVFLAIVAGHHFSPAVLVSGLVAFVCFSMTASSAYLINDLLDLPGDRAHKTKHRRPFAAGSIPVSIGVALSAALAAGAFSLALTLPVAFVEILALYAVTTLAYSVVLKRKVMVDVVVLGTLYTLRVVGGLAAIGANHTPWLLMFSLFLFTALAIVKRCSELMSTPIPVGEKVAGRGYRPEDLKVMFPFGAASAYGAVLVFALYISSPEVVPLYNHPVRLWLVCPLLIYWISRLLILSARNELHEDPVVFALTDRVSLATGVCVAAVLAVSI